MADLTENKPLFVVPIDPPPVEKRARRRAVPAASGAKATRYNLPNLLDSHSPVGYRTRVPLTIAEATDAMQLLALERPSGFAPIRPVTEQEIFEESSLGVLTARQSTNFRGQRQATFGPQTSARIGHLLRGMRYLEGPVLDHVAYTHVVLARPYRTPFTLLLTFVGHKPVLSLGTVPLRAWDKRVRHSDDIPTIGYLQHLHVGILADAMERAAVVASAGRRRAQVFMAPFCGRGRKENKPLAHALEELCGLTLQERSLGWKVALVAQVGWTLPDERVAMAPDTFRKLGAGLLALRSERILPGVNAEAKAPPEYQQPQGMDVPDELTVMAGRAAYNAFAHWAGCDRERAKDLLLLDRVDVLTPDGEARLAAMRDEQNLVTDKLIAQLPLWADLPMGKALSRNAEKGRKAFALVGQRIYIVGLGRRDLERADLDWDHAVRAVGAASSRSALYAELMGTVALAADCDLLCGICLMAGPVNQNDIGKQFYGVRDLLEKAWPDRDPTSLLVWTLKAKTVADPIGNEEQLMNPARQGALVDLRPGPHELCAVEEAGELQPMRQRGGRKNQERAFGDLGNFATGPDGQEIAGNRGSAWPAGWSRAALWPESFPAVSAISNKLPSVKG
ncbi:MAG: hypothetical protein FJ100_20125 [Deltaproteobacteria bacterium]|nr:hypothetical protein [Deltaproteobacteria bacterium]